MTTTRPIPLSGTCVAGTNQQLGSTYLDAWTSGRRRVRLGMLGTTIYMNVDGIQRVSVTDSSISAAGGAGIRFGGIQGYNTGIHMTDLSASA